MFLNLLQYLIPKSYNHFSYNQTVVFSVHVLVSTCEQGGCHYSQWGYSQ